MNQKTKLSEIREISIETINDNPFNPRLYYSEPSVKQLADSIQQYGLIHKILVRRNQGKYEIATGHRRFRAIKLLGWKKVPVEVKELTDAEMLDVAMIENIQRQDLTNVEISVIIGHYLDQGLSQEQIAKKLGKSQPWVSQTVMLKNLPGRIKEDVIRRLINESCAVEFAKFQSWFETQLHPSLQGKEKQQHIRVVTKAYYYLLVKMEKINSVRQLADKLETIKWNLLHSRFWFTRDPFGSSHTKKYWEESDHHERNMVFHKLKHEPLNAKELIWSIKIQNEWYPWDLKE